MKLPLLNSTHNAAHDAAKSRTWAEVDLTAIDHNARLLTQANNGDLMAIVKADAYGHGAIPVSRALEAGANVGHFGVACLSEARELRQAGIRGEIYTLSSFLPHEARELVQKRYNAVCVVV